LAEVHGGGGILACVEAPSPQRIAPFCPHFSRCGGCAVQTLAAEPYAHWKRDLAVNALRGAGVKTKVLDLIDAHGEGRRRAIFHARYPRDQASLGFMRARSHEVIEIDSCPLLAPAMGGALPAARAIAKALAASKRPLDILVTATASGLDIDIRGHGPLDAKERQKLAGAALKHDLARLSIHGETVLMQRVPLLAMGRAQVTPPPGAFLQATQAGENALAAFVLDHASGASHIADLFSGIGTFALRLAEFASAAAFDADSAALAALDRAGRAEGLRPVSVSRRDLFKHPLGADELERFDAAVFDPPRQGAESQAKALASSAVPLAIAVSCNAKTFARDAAILCAGGYEIVAVQPIDQFRHAPHVEIAACFRRTRVRPRKARRVLG
ncbi:MAG: RNA methyltransferase, partial [Beijerinckiaceae bacterium]|nr:RNA methyltransferase [Beijerinckiaceae bacterium]